MPFCPVLLENGQKKDAKSNRIWGEAGGVIFGVAKKRHFLVYEGIGRGGVINDGQQVNLGQLLLYSFDTSSPL